MSAFCPYDYVAAEVNPYPGRIVGREVKSIAGNRDSAVKGEEEATEVEEKKKSFLKEEDEEEERRRATGRGDEDRGAEKVERAR